MSVEGLLPQHIRALISKSLDLPYWLHQLTALWLSVEGYRCNPKRVAGLSRLAECLEQRKGHGALRSRRGLHAAALRDLRRNCSHQERLRRTVLRYRATSQARNSGDRPYQCRLGLCTNGLSWNVNGEDRGRRKGDESGAIRVPKN